MTLIIVIILALLVTKPSEIPGIIKKFQELRLYFINLKNSMLFPAAIANSTSEEIEQLNFYLQKIISIKGNYTGDYNLKNIKEEYFKLMQSKISNSLEENPKIL